ncbi:hypothetical protein LCGC14_0320070 [marine sediment metagenome]|uniref:Uncharacterized protein n=1 Tax=marine sediment metagenome TaxID=412755 RepID=A0A0F9TQ06_9ZZZZ
MSPDTGHVDTMASFDDEEAVPLSPREHGEVLELNRVSRLTAMADGKIRAATRDHRNRARDAAKKIARRR